MKRNCLFAPYFADKLAFIIGNLHSVFSELTMTKTATLRSICACLLILPLLAATASSTGALAQQGIAVLVNDQPITNYDVQQRVKFTAVTQRKPANAQLRRAALDELIDETLIKQEAKRIGVSVTKAEVDKIISEIAARGGRSAPQLKQILRQLGVDASTFESRIASQIAWRQVIQRRFRQNVQVQDRDIDEFLSTKTDQKSDGNVEYDLQSILFLLPKNASRATVEQRTAEARRLGARLESCETSRKLAAPIRDVVIRDIGKRNSASLSKEQAAVLAKVGASKVTPPKKTDQGVEMLAICNKRETSGDEVARLAAQSTLINKEYAELAKRHLFDLRQSAIIEHR